MTTMLDAVARAIQERLSTVPRMVYGEVNGVLCGSLAQVAIDAARPFFERECDDQDDGC